MADDVTATYYNPAGLAQKTGSGIEVTSFFLTDNATSNKSLANTAVANSNNGDFPLPNLNAVGFSPVPEPAGYTSKKFETNATVPFIGAYKSVNDITYALSVYGIGGGGGKWKDSVPVALPLLLGGPTKIDASIDGTYAFIIYNFSAATKLTSKLMLGLGIDVVNMIDDTNVQKYFKNIYGMAVNQSATGYGVQVNGGLLYKFDDKWKGGLVLRSGTTINLKGQAKVYESFAGQAQTDYTDDYTYPMTAAVGVSYEPKSNLTLALTIDQNNYSKMHEKYKYDAQVLGVFADNSGPLQGRDWNDTTQFQIGAEYRCTDKLALRAGIQNDPAPFKTDQLTLIELNQYNFMYYSIGVGYKVCAVDIDVTYASCPSDTPSVGDRNYQYNLDVLRLGLRYSF